MMALVVFAQSGTAQELVPVLNQAKKSIARVTAVKTGNAEAGTGFAFVEPDRLITAYHLVVGADKVLVRFDSGSAPSTARILKVHKRADLALLRLPDGAGAEPMPLGSAPARGSQVLCIGYHYGAGEMDSVSQLKIREIGGSKLEEMLSDENKRIIEELGFPDPKLDMLNVEGAFTPGLSGSPVFDTSGRVVGVVEGGVERGAGGISWAVPITEVKALLRQPDYSPSASEVSVERQGSRMLFSAHLRSASGPTVPFKSFSLVQRRTRTLEEMLRTSEDVAGLQQLLSFFGNFGTSLGDLKFDIYEDIQSGACIVAPQGLRFENKGGILAAQNWGGQFTLLVTLDNVATQMAANPGFQRFENYIMSLSPGSTWQVDQNWSYRNVMQRFDGAWVFRKAAMGLAAWPAPSKYVFLTLATRGKAAIAVAAINNSLAPGPISDPRAKRAWAEMVLSVQLSQFSQ
jgi:hypothetical protein